MSKNRKSLAVACLLASICGKAGAMNSTKKVSPASRQLVTGMSPVLKKVLIGVGVPMGAATLGFGIWGLTKLFGGKDQKPGEPGEQDNKNNEQKDLQIRKEFHKAFLVLTKSPGKMEAKGTYDGKEIDDKEKIQSSVLSIIFDAIMFGNVINNNEIKYNYVLSKAEEGDNNEHNIELKLDEEKNTGKTTLYFEIKSNLLKIDAKAEVFGSKEEKDVMEKTYNEEKMLIQCTNIEYLSKISALDFVDVKAQKAEGGMLTCHIRNVKEGENYVIINENSNILKITYELSDDFKKLKETVEKYNEGINKEDIENKKVEPTSTDSYEFYIKSKNKSI